MIKTNFILSTWAFEQILALLKTWLQVSNRHKKRQHSSARSDLGNLDPVEEEVPMVQDVRGFKIRRLSEEGPVHQDSGTIEHCNATDRKHIIISKRRLTWFLSRYFTNQLSSWLGLLASCRPDRRNRTYSDSASIEGTHNQQGHRINSIVSTEQDIHVFNFIQVQTNVIWTIRTKAQFYTACKSSH